jgi:hypothetical protein
MSRITRVTPALLWHYTVGGHWFQIEASGYIDVARDLVPVGERPAAWFSANQEWEPTIRRGLMQADGTPVPWAEGKPAVMTKEEMHRTMRGLWRIGVRPDVAPVDWDTFCRTSGIDALMALALVQAGQELGADPADWFCSFHRVPAGEWQRVEFWFMNRWNPVAGYGDVTPHTLTAEIEARSDVRDARAGRGKAWRPTTPQYPHSGRPHRGRPDRLEDRYPEDFQ